MLLEIEITEVDLSFLNRRFSAEGGFCKYVTREAQSLVADILQEERQKMPLELTLGLIEIDIMCKVLLNANLLYDAKQNEPVVEDN